jgi:hypothetical protein
LAFAQGTPAKVPCTGVPSPIKRLNKPKAFVVRSWVSWYCTGPLAEPPRMEIRILTEVFASIVPLLFLATAW